MPVAPHAIAAPAEKILRRKFFNLALSQQTVDFGRFFATRLRVILSGVPPRSHFGYASCFWGVAPKVRQAQDDTYRCPAGRSRNPTNGRIKRDSSRLESRKKSVISCERAKGKNRCCSAKPFSLHSQNRIATNKQYRTRGAGAPHGFPSLHG